MKEGTTMRYIKLVVLVLIIGFCFLFFYQNRDYLLSTNAFTVDLHFFNYTLPALATGFYIVFAFLLGLVVMFLFSLFPHFKTTKELRQLRTDRANIERLKKENAELLDDICMLREQTTPEEAPAGSRVLSASDPAAEAYKEYSSN